MGIWEKLGFGEAHHKGRVNEKKPHGNLLSDNPTKNINGRIVEYI